MMKFSFDEVMPTIFQSILNTGFNKTCHYINATNFVSGCDLTSFYVALIF